VPKQVLQIANFSGGLNADANPRDIEDNQFCQNWNASVDSGGIIRASGMATDTGGISTDYATNEKFQNGVGLFQFSADYSVADIASNFSTGLTTGTRAGSNSTTAHNLEDKTSVSSTDADYVGRIMFIYAGTGIGESRVITAYDYTGGATERLITTEAFATTLNTTSKYIIFDWKIDTTNLAGKDDVVKKDFITNGRGGNMLDAINSNFSNDYYIFSRKAGIADEQSENLGYIEYGSSLALTPGAEYTLSFECASKNPWYNLVSKGDTNPASGSENPYGDKVPWVQLYSTTVADTNNSIKSLDAASVSTSAAWTDGTYTGLTQSKTTGSGQGAIFNIVVTSSGGTATFHIEDRGHGYAVDEELTFNDPLGTGRTATIVLAAVNVTGLSLYASNNNDISLWKSGIVGNGSTSKYISYVDNNYISNGDFTNGNTGWTVGSSASGSEASSAGARYGGHDGTLLLSRTGGSLEDPLNNSWDAYIYQDLTLDENTMYHLNFLYDAYQGQGGITYAVYDTTNSVWLVEPTGIGVTREAYFPDGSATPVNFVAGGSKNISSNSSDMNYVPFKVNHATLNFTTTTCTIRIGFAKTIEGLNDIRLAGVTTYKGHNDLVTMNYKKSSNKSSNPFTNEIKNFSKYSLKFKVPNNYSSVSDWILRLHAGQYSNRNSNNLNAADEQEVYFNNIFLSSNQGDTITLLSNNSNSYSDILFYTNLSSSWHTNIIKWLGLNSSPTFNYINGMLKISDGNFNNNNNNKLLYYSNNENNLGWELKDNAIQNPPDVVAGDITTTQILNEPNNCIEFLNSELQGQVGNYNSTNSVGYIRSAGSHAAAYGPNDIQGFVTRYWYETSTAIGSGMSGNIVGEEYSGNNLFTDEGETSGQLFIPRYNNNNGQTSDWYQSNVLSNNPLDYYGAGGYDEDVQVLPTGNIDNTDSGDIAGSITDISSDRINFMRLNIKDTNSATFTANAPMHTTYKDIGIPSSCLQNISNPNAGDIARIEIEFEYECFGFSRADIQDEMNAPSFEISIGKPDLPNITDDIIMQNVNTDYEVVSFSPIAERTYGNNSNSSNPITSITAENYNIIGQDKGECISVNWANDEIEDMSRFKATFRDSIELSKGAISKDDKIIIRVRDILNKEGMSNFFNVIYATPRNDYWDGNSSSSSASSNFFQRRSSTSAIFTRFMINKLDIYYYNNDADFSEEEELGQLSSMDTKALFQWDKPLNDSSLSWGERAFKLGVSTVNIFGEESAISQYSDIIGGTNTGDITDEFPEGEPLPVIELGFCPSVTVQLSNSLYKDSYINKTKFYMKDEKSDIWYLQFLIDHEKGIMRSTTSGIEANLNDNPSLNVSRWTLERENFMNFNEVNSYESETMISQNDGLDTGNLNCRYKVSTIANNRLYVGNIMQKGKVFGDRMIKSPINKYNILPSSNFIDVAINDGDEITALEYYKDKILQFKKRKVFVINVAGDYEFLEDTFNNIGVGRQCSVTRTPYGIAWANQSGCYVYDGGKVINLIENKIPSTNDYTHIDNNYWIASTASGVPVIGYMQDEDSILIKWEDSNDSDVALPDAITYHFPTKSWMFNFKSIAGNANAGNTGNISNMITDKDGHILYNRFHSSSVAYNGIKKWQNSPLKTGSLKAFYFRTKDFTFGNIVNRKKIYKIYITYKVGTDGTDSGVGVYAQKDSGNYDLSTVSNNIVFSQSSKFAGTNTDCYTSGTLNETDGLWKTAELKFDNPSEANNIYSFQILLYTLNGAADFEINDISIVYKIKRVK
jgi:hypothetical protein